MTTEDFMDMAEKILTPELVEYKLERLHSFGWFSLWGMAVAALVVIVAAILLTVHRHKIRKSDTPQQKTEGHYIAWWFLCAGLVAFAVFLVIYCIVLYETYEWVYDPIEHIYLNLKDWL